MSEIAQASVKQQLQMLKEQTRLTGGLHEAQVLQLKMWPFVVFQNASGSSFTWDPDKKTVIFIIELPKGGKSRKNDGWWKGQTRKLNEWVQELLGDEWCIKVKVGKSTYSGLRRVLGPGTKPMTVKVRDAVPGTDAGPEGSTAH